VNLSSPAFQDDKPIPTKYSHHGVVGGKNISLPFIWTNPPKETRSFALSIIDPHPVAKNWIHWFVINIPRGISSLQEGDSCRSIPSGSKELYNSYGTIGYGGPEPPKGSGPHPYVVTIYAIKNDSLDISQNASLAAFQKALEGNVLASAKITGIYER
jgi:Raf kinase inhibitor-like YbhB/YbcL family protein